MSPLSKKRGHHDLRILRFERIASTAAVRTRGDFGIIPSPCDIDAERKMRSKTAAKIYERSMRESLARRRFLKLESFATRCEALLPYDRERCIIRTIFVAGGRTEMAISYNKLWKLLVEADFLADGSRAVWHDKTLLSKYNGHFSSKTWHPFQKTSSPDPPLLS